MGFIIQYVADAAPIIYAVCGFIALIQIYRTWQVRAERRQAIFSLEREKALNDLYNIFLTAMTLLFVMGATYFVSTTLARAVEPIVEQSLSPEPESIALIPTPTNTPLSATATPTSMPTSLPPTMTEPVQDEVTPQQVTVEAESESEPPTATPTNPPPAVSPALCPDGRSRIVSPGNGAVVSGSEAVVGTAQHDEFDYYKLEYAPGSNASEGWAYFDGGQTQVANGLLGNLNSSALANGVYTIRLVVVDRTANYPEPCRVTLTIQN